ncbi:MAG TPA: PorP/SprF family type IX secretion system membrane protein, partial [Bacteroidia bacterium]|nr:PorP/SprF family type IX secretion system membrane protein [Bacteroidia bacterium]
QWAGIDGAPTTAAFSVHSPIMNNKLGVGLNIVSDKIGAKTVSAFYGNISYILKIGNTTKLAFGARAGYAMYKFNFNEVKYKDADETAYTDLNNANKGSLDVDAGLYLRTNKFFVGLSATHLNN